MKKLCLLLFFCILSITTVFADGPRFNNMRTVVIAETTQDSYAARFMKNRLKQPFRIPYWDRIETDTALSPSDVNIDTMRALRPSIKPTSSWSPSSRPGTGGSTWPGSGAMMMTKSSRNVSIT